MEKDVFEQLKDELTSLAPFDGIRMSDLLLLPDQVRSLLNWMVRQNGVQFEQLVTHLEKDTPNTHLILDTLISKGLVEEITGEEDQYQVNLKASRNYRVSPNIWKVLDDH